jgi:hypothetical protein
VLLGLLRFTAVAVGVSPLGFDSDPLFGENIVGRNGLSLPVETSVGRVAVQARPVTVPEPPASLLLLAAGVLLLLFRLGGRRPAPPSTRS